MYGVTKDSILIEAQKKFGALEQDKRMEVMDKLQEIIDDMYFESCDMAIGDEEESVGLLGDLLFYAVVLAKMNCRTTEELAVRGIERFKDEMAKS